MGTSPNRFTHGLEKISWALIFCSTWWMLWRLDLFIASPNRTKQEPQPDKPEKIKKGRTDWEENDSKVEEPKRSENFIPEDFEDEQAVDSDDTRKAEKTPEDVKRVIFPTVEDLEMAEILGLSKDMLDDFSRIKATYRTAIAQYHPDKVSALGAEIQDVAEKKAKEINQAYQYFRNKLKKT